MSKNLSDNLILEEYKEAMNQRRHLETMRSTYLGVYFAFLVGVLGLVFALLEKNSNSHWVALGVPILLWILNTITTMVYISARKMSALLGYYDNVTTVVRKKIYGEKDSEDLVNSFGSYEARDKVLDKHIFSQTGMVDKFLQFMALALFTANAIAVVTWQTKGMYQHLETLILSFLFLILLVFQLAIRSQVVPMNRHVRFHKVSEPQNNEPNRSYTRGSRPQKKQQGK